MGGRDDALDKSCSRLVQIGNDLLSSHGSRQRPCYLAGRRIAALRRPDQAHICGSYGKDKSDMLGLAAQRTCATIGRILLNLSQRRCCFRVQRYQDAIT